MVLKFALMKLLFLWKGLERSDDAVSQRDAVNTNGTITWAINTDGITSVDSGNSATVDITTAALFSGNGTEDDPTNHDITFHLYRCWIWLYEQHYENSDFQSSSYFGNFGR